MINLTEKARSICSDLEKNGFNGVYFHKAKVEEKVLSDYWSEFDKEGELTPKQFDKYCRDYVCFITEPDIPYDLMHRGYENSPYVEQASFSETTFLDDLEAFVKKQFKRDIKVTFRRGSIFEFEVIREKSLAKYIK